MKYLADGRTRRRRILRRGESLIGYSRGRSDIENENDRLRKKRFNALPGFGLAMGFTLFYLSAIVLIPFAGLVIRTCELSWSDFWRLATTDRGWRQTGLRLERRWSP